MLMMSARPILIGEKLDEGYNLIFTDVDFIWTSNPLPYFQNATSDVVPKDEYHYDLFSSMDPSSGRRKRKPGVRCAGLFAMISCASTRRLVGSWRLMMGNRTGHNQRRYTVAINKMDDPRVVDYPLPRDLFVSGQHFKKIQQ
jgi:hypothetical protein